MELTKQHVLDFLKTNKLMSVATFGAHPWIANVFYVSDNELNLYFLSDEKTLHCQQIAQNKKVAVAIVDSHQSYSDKLMGFQAWGTVKQISDLEKLKFILKGLQQLLKAGDDLSYEKAIQKVASNKIYKITPKRIKLYSEGLFGELPSGEEPVLEL